jgi:hypothetical protein
MLCHAEYAFTGSSVTSLRPNLVKRIARLPKPANLADALQPLFEAISNAIHSTQERFGKDVARNGRVDVTISLDRRKEGVSATVLDNGPGLDAKNWEAFITTDTDNKIGIGGKGVGRLLWLDCFQDIRVESVFAEGPDFKRRRFTFVLEPEDQIKDLVLEDIDGATDPFFLVKFGGLRANGYLDKFPGRATYLHQHLTSHFLPTFIGKRCPQIAVDVGGDAREYPDQSARSCAAGPINSPSKPRSLANYV